ncbi:hypothetical protein V6R21_13055 [Limibacter armeniacum]|uniref:hypothetical protein n=1 Tax=Limibacter armeniacum TaxID=466084 RepID=UPI002FE591E9
MSSNTNFLYINIQQPRFRGLIVLIAFLLITPSVSWAQIECDTCGVKFSENKFLDAYRKKAVFVTDSAESLLDKARLLINMGDDMQRIYSQPDEALKYYLGAYDFLSDDAELNFKVGKSLVMSVSEDKTSAIPFLRRAVELNPNVNDSLSLLLGRAYHLNYQWDSAMIYYHQAEKKVGLKSDWKISKYIKECESGKWYADKKNRTLIKNLGPAINSRFSDYGLMIDAAGKQIFFTSRRHEFRSDNPDVRTHLTEHIYSAKVENGKWSQPKPVEGLADDNQHNATVSLSDNGEHMILYREEDLFVSHFGETGWSTPKKLSSKINSPYLETSAAFNNGGDTLYLVSDRPGESVGGLDIFIVTKENGKWKYPDNIGEHINSEYDEEGVFVTADGQYLYFSSRGHDSIGGYDIFRCERKEDGSWGKPINMGMPLNTPDDDVYFVLEYNGRHGYYSSVRNGGYGEKDLYRVTLLGKEKPLPFDNEEEWLTEDAFERDEDRFAGPKIQELIQHIMNGTGTMLMGIDEVIQEVNKEALLRKE